MACNTPSGAPVSFGHASKRPSRRATSWLPVKRRPWWHRYADCSTPSAHAVRDATDTPTSSPRQRATRPRTVGARPPVATYDTHRHPQTQLALRCIKRRKKTRRPRCNLLFRDRWNAFLPSSPPSTARSNSHFPTDSGALIYVHHDNSLSTFVNRTAWRQAIVPAYT